MFGDMGDNNRILDIDTLNSKGRHQSINKICVGHTVTDLNTKARENIPAKKLTSNSSQLFFNRLLDRFFINANLYRFNLYQYGVIKYSIFRDYCFVLDKG